MTRSLLAAALLSLCACGGGASTPDGGSTPDSGPPDAGTVSVPLTIQSYPQGQGKFFLVPVSVGGSSFDVLLDTGSCGLRLFSATPLGTPNGEDVPGDFGSGLLCGPTEVAAVLIGGVPTDGPIAFQRVVSCDAGTDLEAQLASFGIQGVLGASLRADAPQDVFTPLVQLGPALSRGFLIQSGGYSSTSGSLTLGVGSDALPGAQPIALAVDPRRDAGPPAWNDAPSVCFKVNGTPTAPSCSSTYLDTGANFAIVQDTLMSGVLPAGTTFEATSGSAFDLSFTVGSPPTTSLDQVQLSPQPYTNLGIEFFFHFDVAYDTADGRLAMRPQGT